MLEARTASQVSPRLSHTEVLTACHKAHHWQQALATELRDLRPDVACRNVFMGIWSSEGRWRKALELLEGLKEEEKRDSMIHTVSCI